MTGRDYAASIVRMVNADPLARMRAVICGGNGWIVAPDGFGRMGPEDTLWEAMKAGISLKIGERRVYRDGYIEVFTDCIQVIGDVYGPEDPLDERVNGDPDGGEGEEAEVSFDAEDDGDDTENEW